MISKSNFSSLDLLKKKALQTISIENQFQTAFKNRKHEMKYVHLGMANNIKKHLNRVSDKFKLGKMIGLKIEE
jgi:hypothetical protein